MILYFSGTGNSKFIAELFCKYIDAKCYSIEETADFSNLISYEDCIGFCYPIYASRVPRIMREFVLNHIEHLENKKIIIFCTQVLFSGDGARAFMDIFSNVSIDVIYAEHFFMPTNVCNLSIWPIPNESKIKNYIVKAEKKMKKVCHNIKNDITVKRGFNIISRILGLSQGLFFPAIEKYALNRVMINDNCIKCKLCSSICPMNNLEFQGEKIVHKSNCTICYRCINKCPQKAINVFFLWKINKQYKGSENY